jgi:hypothetical protein
MNQGGLLPNNPIKLPVRSVTPRACARVAPSRPARYAERSADRISGRPHGDDRS